MKRLRYRVAREDSVPIGCKEGKVCVRSLEQVGARRAIIGKQKANRMGCAQGWVREWNFISSKMKTRPFRWGLTQSGTGSEAARHLGFKEPTSELLLESGAFVAG